MSPENRPLSLAVYGLAGFLVSPFSFAVEEGVQRSPRGAVGRPLPAWVDSVATTAKPYAETRDDFEVATRDKEMVRGRPADSRPRYVCREIIKGGVRSWEFCSM